jgi:hypothetical protein
VRELDRFKSEKTRMTVAAEKPRKFKFKRPKVQVLTILDDQKKEVGSVRIEPGEIAWRPGGHSGWYTLPMQDFGKLAVSHGAKGASGK